jgi:hypothetical protein
MSENHHLVSGDFHVGVMAQAARSIRRRPASKLGGILLIAVEIDPARQNYPNVGFCRFGRPRAPGASSRIAAGEEENEKPGGLSARGPKSSTDISPREAPH